MFEEFGGFGDECGVVMMVWCGVIVWCMWGV